MGGFLYDCGTMNASGAYDTYCRFFCEYVVIGKQEFQEHDSAKACIGRRSREIRESVLPWRNFGMFESLSVAEVM